MRKEQLERNIPLQNKLTLPFNSSTIIETTIDNVLNTGNIDECIVVLGHFSDEILPLINKIDDYEKQSSTTVSGIGDGVMQ